jgi:hypothetical protein
LARFDPGRDIADLSKVAELFDRQLDPEFGLDFESYQDSVMRIAMQIEYVVIRPRLGNADDLRKDGGDSLFG